VAYDYDLFVIGAGSGGVRAARIAAQHGARVAIAEEDRVGGTCVIRGCIPKKLFVYASAFREAFEDAAGYGWTVGKPAFDWPILMANKDREIDRLNKLYIRNLEASGAKLMPVRAELEDAHTVRLADGGKVTAETILIATGALPSLNLAVPGAELAITSNEAFHLPELPRRIVIAGGGYIAVEFAGIFKGLGAAVTIAYRGDVVLRGFDDDVRTHLSAELIRHGIDIRLHCDLLEVARRPDGSLDATLHTPMGVETLQVDAVMLATGRWPNTGGLGLEPLGVELDELGGVVVDEWGQSTVPGIHAVGDVTNRIALTPVAIREGAALSATLFGGQPTRIDHGGVPYAVFSDPPIGGVGLTEAEARNSISGVQVFKATFRPMKATLSGREQKTLMKLIVDAPTQRVVGAHMVGPDAPEIIQMAAIAVKAGLTKAQFDATVAVHPTAAEEFVTMR
jgi:glutathione reductase (NADPH)